MSKITFKYDEKDAISAFAFNTGCVIEEIIKQRTEDLESRTKILEAKLLDYYMKMPEGILKSEFGGYFGIIRQEKGKV